MLIKMTTFAEAEKILFVPHDIRPISHKQTVEVVQQLGYKIVFPPNELLLYDENNPNTDALWNWIDENIQSTDAAVLSSDLLLYGGLIPSRKHNIPKSVIDDRLERFKTLRKNNPQTRIYILSSLMRTPTEGVAGFNEDPKYYETYGSQIFTLTLLLDKQEILKLNDNEKWQLNYLKNNIPTEYLDDYFKRRAKNLSATKKLIDFVNQGIFDYLLVGKDDNSPFCQTHRENRELMSYAESLPKTKFQSLSGIDEFGLILLVRAVNDIRGESPTVNVKYNKGKGEKTIPAYANESIGKYIEETMMIAGGRIADDPKLADLVLLVNTDQNGKTYFLHNSSPKDVPKLNEKKLDKQANHFANLVDEYVEAGYPVGIADITYVNGADNALMKHLYNKGLLYKIQAYSGWNTATNSTGFAIGTGILAKYMSNDSKDRLLTIRYLDDWAYQANVRTMLSEQFFNSREGMVNYYSLGDKTEFVNDRVTYLMRDFANRKLPPFEYLKDFYVTLPWQRMFECDIHFVK